MCQVSFHLKLWCCKFQFNYCSHPSKSIRFLSDIVLFDGRVSGKFRCFLPFETDEVCCLCLCGLIWILCFLWLCGLFDFVKSKIYIYAVCDWKISDSVMQEQGRVFWIARLLSLKQEFLSCWCFCSRYKKSDSNREDWITLRVVPDDAISLTVYNLLPLTSYQFMVLSRNRLGEGLFSQPVHQTTKGRVSTYLLISLQSFNAIKVSHNFLKSYIVLFRNNSMCICNCVCKYVSDRICDSFLSLNVIISPNVY